MATVIGSIGRMRLFCDFTGTSGIVTAVECGVIGDGFYSGGEGIEDTDSGVLGMETGGLSGVGRLTTHATNLDAVFVGTHTCFDVALMGPLYFEARVQFADLNTKAVYIGFSDIATIDDQITDMLDSSTATTLGIAASDLCGFSLSSELTEDEMWHCPFAGGSATTETVSTEVESGVDAVAGEWQLLKLEIDPNGTARWYIDNVLVQTKVGAVSTTTDLNFKCMIGANGSTAATMDVDYILLEANRDWTV